MKTLILTSFLVGFSFTDTPSFTLGTHPMYSKIWEKKYEIVKSEDGSYDTTSVIVPKSGGKFKLLNEHDLDSIRTSIDFEMVRKNMISYLNEFRSDYKVPSVVENKSLSASSNEYADYLMRTNQVVHSKHPSKRFEEALVFVPFGLFSRVTKEDGDINVLILESCFDIFVGSPAHTSILLNDDPNRTFGAGISVTDTGFYVVVQSIVN